MSKLKALQPKQGEGERSSKETNQENKPWHWLSHRKVSEMFGRGESNKSAGELSISITQWGSKQTWGGIRWRFDMLLVDRSQQLPTPPALRAAITVNILP